MDSINHFVSALGTMTKLEKSGDEKVLPRLSPDGNQKAAAFNLPETEDLETTVDQFKIQRIASVLWFAFLRSGSRCLKYILNMNTQTLTQECVFPITENGLVG